MHVMDVGWELCCILGCCIKHDKNLLDIQSITENYFTDHSKCLDVAAVLLLAVLDVFIHVLIKIDDKDIYSSCFDMEQESVSQQT